MFDIDGTLVHSHGFDGDLFAAAVKHELGVQVDETWSSYQHVTDSGVLEDVLRERVAVAERQQAYRRVKARFVGLVRDFTADQPKGLVPVLGAPEFIRELRCKAGVVVAFATGGWRETAAMKLQSVGIEFESSPFATSSDAASRTEIMRLAERQAAACGSSARQTYFGDAPWDKKASADLGYDFVAVGGRVEHSQRFEDFSDQKAVLDVLGVYQVDASDLGR